MSRLRLRRSAKALPTHVMLFLLCLVWAVPAAGLLVSSFRTVQDQATGGWWEAFVNPRFTLDNFVEAFQTVNVGSALVNSALIAVPTTLLVVGISALTAFAFAWLPFRGSRVLFLLIVSLLVVPPQVTLAPMLQLMTAMGLSGTVASVWIYQVGLSIPFGVLVLRNAFAALPEELLEAARIDGASTLTTFWRIVLPVSTPSLAAVATLQFLWAWNDLLSPLIFLNGRQESNPITVQIAGLVQSTGTGENLLIAAAVLAIVVPIGVFAVLQRYFVRGVLGGAVKG